MVTVTLTHLSGVQFQFIIIITFINKVDYKKCLVYLPKQIQRSIYLEILKLCSIELKKIVFKIFHSKSLDHKSKTIAHRKNN